ncbi:MAG: hypothetical protein Fur003_5920 [Candidatus Dojkabacteria bacterium]
MKPDSKFPPAYQSQPTRSFLSTEGLFLLNNALVLLLFGWLIASIYFEGIPFDFKIFGVLLLIAMTFKFAGRLISIVKE